MFTYTQLESIFRTHISQKKLATRVAWLEGFKKIRLNARRRMFHACSNQRNYSWEKGTGLRRGWLVMASMFLARSAVSLIFIWGAFSAYISRNVFLPAFVSQAQKKDFIFFLDSSFSRRHYIYNTETTTSSAKLSKWHTTMGLHQAQAGPEKSANLRLLLKSRTQRLILVSELFFGAFNKKVATFQRYFFRQKKAFIPGSLDDLGFFVV